MAATAVGSNPLGVKPGAEPVLGQKSGMSAVDGNQIAQPPKADHARIVASIFGHDVRYVENDMLPAHFFSWLCFGLKKNLERGDCTENRLEWLGTKGLWVVEELPKKIWEGMKDPRVVTIVLTALSCIAISFTFYPFLSFAYMKFIISIIPFPAWWQIRFASYIICVGVAISAGLRAYGRITNHVLTTMYGYPNIGHKDGLWGAIKEAFGFEKRTNFEKN